MALISCPECNNNISDRAETCPRCGFPIHNKKNTYKIIYKGYKDTDTAAMAALKVVLNLSDNDIDKIVYNYPCQISEFANYEDANICAIRLDKRFVEVQILDINDHVIAMDKNVCFCPKCFSTNIQIIAKKWSILTGFYTNKTNRVCVQCNNKF